MSLRAMVAVMDHSEARSTARLTMIVLADHADDYGICWPGFERIAHKARVSARTVMRQVESLVTLGEVVTFPRPGDTTVYVLTVPGLLPWDDAATDKVRKLGAAVTPDNLAPLSNRAPDDTRTVTNKPITGSTDVEPGPGGPVAPSPARALSDQEKTAQAVLTEFVLPVLRGGAGYNAVTEFGKAFREGWRRCLADELNPTQFGVAVVAHYCELMQVPVEYSKLGRLVGNYGIYALLGIEAAFSRDLEGDWLPYAWEVARRRRAEAQASRVEQEATA